MLAWGRWVMKVAASQHQVASRDQKRTFPVRTAKTIGPEGHQRASGDIPAKEHDGDAVV